MRSLISVFALIVFAGAAQAHGYGAAVVRQRVYVQPQVQVYAAPVCVQPVVQYVQPVVQQVQYVQQVVAPVCYQQAVVQDYCAPAAVRVNVGQRLFQRQVIRSRNVQKVRGY